MIATPNPAPGADGSALSPYSLADALAKAPRQETIYLRGGDYAGAFNLRTPGVILAPYEGEPAQLIGPAQFTRDKIAWLHIWPEAAGAKVDGLRFARQGDIGKLWAAGWEDYGVVVEAPGAMIDSCKLAGMAKGIHVKGKTSTLVTLTNNTIGPTIDSCIAVGTSYGVLRRLLIGWNHLYGSYREDGIQFMQNFEAPDPTLDVSNLGAIIYHNYIHHCNENAIDLKGAGFIVCDRNLIRYIGGSSNGAPNWNHRSPMSIMHGADTAAGLAIIRNNDIQQSSSGIRVFDLWHIYHNLLLDNNYDPAGGAWAGTGILQPSPAPNAAVKNNLVSGHMAKDLAFTTVSPAFVNNPSEAGPGMALTTTRSAGSGRSLPVKDAKYFTDWFGRPELPPEIVYVGSQEARIMGVDYAANILELDRWLEWGGGGIVAWLSPLPVVGLQEPYSPPHEPPPSTEDDELVQLILEASMPPAEAAQLRALLAGRAVNVRLGGQ